jgi:hypothetical protein
LVTLKQFTLSDCDINCRLQSVSGMEARWKQIVILRQHNANLKNNKHMLQNAQSQLSINKCLSIPGTS